MSIDGFMERMDKRMSQANDRKWRKLLAWGEVLDAAGWCVALARLEGEPWLSVNAVIDLELRGIGSDDLSGLSKIPGMPPSLIDQGAIRLWTAAAEKNLSVAPMPKLTRREDEIFNWLRAGKSGPEVALILGCAIRTVEKHVANLYRKIGASNRTSAIFNRPVIHS